MRSVKNQHYRKNNLVDVLSEITVWQLTTFVDKISILNYDILIAKI